MVRRKSAFLAMLFALFLGALSTLAATPNQGKPPQPFGPDSFSGQATVEGTAPPRGMQLFACIDDCSVFKSATVTIRQGGRYSQLVVSPVDRSLVGHPVLFYLANEFGRIKAAEDQDFQGATETFTLNLTFSDPIPVPTPTPTITPTASLPVPGDPIVTAIPGWVLLAGTGAVLAGVTLLLVARRRATY